MMTRRWKSDMDGLEGVDSEVRQALKPPRAVVERVVACALAAPARNRRVSPRVVAGCLILLLTGWAALQLLRSKRSAPIKGEMASASLINVGEVVTVTSSSGQIWIVNDYRRSRALQPSQMIMIVRGD